MSVRRRALLAAVGLVLSRSGLAEATEPLEVIVRGEPVPAATSRDPSSASTVLRRRQLGAAGTDAADALSRVPGVQVTRRGGSADLATVSVRGAASAQTPVYLAGILLNDELTGAADLSTLPLWMLDRIEVYRGNAPADADAHRLGIGGAIFFEPRLPQKSGLGGGAAVGSFGERAIWTAGTAAAADAASMFAIRRELAKGDYVFTDDNQTRFVTTDDREVRRPNADHDAYDSWAIARYRLGPRGARATVLVNAFDREQGVTGLGIAPALHARQHVRRLLTGIVTQLPCTVQAKSHAAAGTAPCELTLRTSLLRARSEISDPSRELSLFTARLTTAGERLVQTGSITQSLSNSSKLGLGLAQELDRQRLFRSGGPTHFATRSVTRLSSSLRVRAGRLDLSALAAFSCHITEADQTSGAGAPRDNETAAPQDTRDSCGVLAPEGRLGMLTTPVPGLEFLGNVGHYVRVPTLGELYGTSPQVRGNPELEPERGLTGELGLRFKSERERERAAQIWFEVFAFARTAAGLIIFKNSNVGYVRPFNVGSARVLGTELAVGTVLWNHLQSELNVTLLDPRDTSDERSVKRDLLPFTSRLVASQYLELFAALPGSMLERTALGGRLSYRSSRTQDSAGLIVIGEQFVLDLELSANFKRSRLNAKLSAENMLGAAHYDAIGFPLPGRSLHASVEAWWD